MPARVAIDAANLARDRRGLGRIVRPVVTAACDDPRFTVTLLADRAADVRELRSTFPAAAVAPSRTARRTGRYDAVWFPFNGMRYPAAAPALVSVADAFAFTEPHPDRVARFREQAPIRRAARAAARIVTISAWSRQEIARELVLPPERIAVVPPAPDPFWTPGTGGGALPAALAGRRFALVVGVREARKNARLALEACARALRGEDELLVIVGDLSAVDRAFARSRGLRCGEITPSDGTLRALYREAAVVLVPSLAEGFGLVALEAMACGTPVLAANAAALPETTGGAAVLLDPGDPEAWAREIRALLDDGERAALLRSGGLAFVAGADPAGPALALLKLLDELARGPAES